MCVCVCVCGWCVGERRKTDPITDTMVKGLIVVGGHSKGTRFRPLSLDCPKPLFPIGGRPMIEHHIEALAGLENLEEVILMGFYPKDEMESFIFSCQRKFKIKIRYLEEEGESGTAGALLAFTSEILSGGCSEVVIMHCDIICAFPLVELLERHRTCGGIATIASTVVSPEDSNSYGCMVSKESGELVHYAEKPVSHVSDTINAGIYVFSPAMFDEMADLRKFATRSPSSNNLQDYLELHTHEIFRLEKDVLVPLSSTGKIFTFPLEGFWAQIKNPAAAVRCSEMCMEIDREQHPELLAIGVAGGPEIVGNVHIDPTAEVDPTAKIGPNVTIGAGAHIGKGVRVSNAIILEGVILKDRCCILNAILGWNSSVGKWARVEGQLVYSQEVNASGEKMTIFGAGVNVYPEVLVQNSIVLPNKDLTESIRNTILL